METLEIFPTRIHIFKSNLDLNSIEKVLIDMKESGMKSEVNSNSGGWQSISNLHRVPALDDLYNFQGECLSKILSKVNPCSYTLSNSWANINMGTDSNISHIHPMSQWSTCFYVRVPGGNIQFLDPRAINLMQDSRLSEEGNKVYSLQPEEGDFIAFPAWLYHSVTPSESLSPRISIASNYSVQAIEEL